MHVCVTVEAILNISRRIFLTFSIVYNTILSDYRIFIQNEFLYNNTFMFMKQGGFYCEINLESPMYKRKGLQKRFPTCYWSVNFKRTLLLQQTDLHFNESIIFEHVHYRIHTYFFIRNPHFVFNITYIDINKRLPNSQYM